MQTIAVIGSGFSGSLAAVHLLRISAGLRLRVVLFDRTDRFGPGLAYGNGSESLLLNVVAGRMSALPEEPADFLRWARGVDPSVRGETFLPRRMYGRYLEALLERAASAAGPGVELQRIGEEVVELRPTPAGVEVVCRGGDRTMAARVVLATGNFAPASPSWCSEELRSDARYIADPWRGEGLSRVGCHDRVLVIGTGLTMMDAVLSLAEAGHREKIEAVSRRGLLPQAHRHGNPGLAKLPDPLFSTTFSRVKDLLRSLRAEAERAESMGGDWRDVVNAMRSITPTLWGALDERERRRFLDRLSPFWNTHRHRAPPSVAEGIERLMGAGRLVVRAARVREVIATPDALDVSMQPRGAGWPEGGVTLRVDRVINCTGPASDAGKSGNALVEGLLETGMAKPGPLGMGLATDDVGSLVRADGSVEDRVVVVGPARIGQLWETTAAPELRVQAAESARRILASLRGPSSVGAVIEVRPEGRAGAVST